MQAKFRSLERLTEWSSPEEDTDEEWEKEESHSSDSGDGPEPAVEREQPTGTLISSVQLSKSRLLPPRPGNSPIGSVSVRPLLLVSCLERENLRSCLGYPDFSNWCRREWPWSGAWISLISLPKSWRTSRALRAEYIIWDYLCVPKPSWVPGGAAWARFLEIKGAWRLGRNINKDRVQGGSACRKSFGPQEERRKGLEETNRPSVLCLKSKLWERQIVFFLFLS